MTDMTAVWGVPCVWGSPLLNPLPPQSGFDCLLEGKVVNMTAIFKGTDRTEQ